MAAGNPNFEDKDKPQQEKAEKKCECICHMQTPTSTAYAYAEKSCIHCQPKAEEKECICSVCITTCPCRCHQPKAEEGWEERAKESIGDVVSATRAFIEGRITRIERENIYDKHILFIAQELARERDELIKKVKKMQRGIRGTFEYEILDRVLQAIKEKE